MKKINFLFTLVTAMMMMWGMGASAQTTAGNDDFKSVFEGMKATGGNIQLTENVILTMGAGETYSLSNAGGSVINIDVQGFSIQAVGTGTTADNAILEVGDNVNISGTSTVLTSSARAKISVVGGTVTSTGVGGNGTIETQGGWVYVSGGRVTVNSAGTGYRCAIYMANYMTLEITGGTIEAIGENTRAVRISDGAANIGGSAGNVTITATGNNAYALLSIAGNTMNISKNLTVTTSSGAGNDAALVGGASGAGGTPKIIIPDNAQNISITSSRKYALDNNTTAVVLDLRNASLTANPASGATFTNPSTITLTASGNESFSLPSFKIYYNYGMAPTSASSTVSNGGTVNISSSTSIVATVGVPDASFNPKTYSFSYTVQNASGPKLIANYAEFKQACLDYQADPAAMNPEWRFTGPIAIAEAFTFEPIAGYPIAIDANNNLISLGRNNVADTYTVTFGGNLEITTTTAAGTPGTAGNGLFRVYGPMAFKITGGTYTQTANTRLIFLETGSGVDNGTQNNYNTGTRLIFSDAKFVVNGTNNARIIYWNTTDGKSFSASNCEFELNITGNNAAMAFELNGGQHIDFTDCKLTIDGTNTGLVGISQYPTNNKATLDLPIGQRLTIDGLIVNQSEGTFINWKSGTGLQNIYTVIKDLTFTGSVASVVKPTISSSAGGTVQNLYDFRGYDITPSVAPGEISDPITVSLSLPGTITPNPWDAAGLTVNDIYYNKVGSLKSAMADTQYSGGDILVNPGETLNVYVMKGGFTSKVTSFVYDMSTGITAPEIGEANVYIVANTLFLPESGAVQLYNVGGQLVLNAIAIGSTIDVSSLSKGIYIVKAGDAMFKVAK